MKRYIAVIAGLTGLLVLSPAQAQDPCKTLFCMTGKAGLNDSSLADSDCSGAISDFYSIVVKKKGKFKPEATSKAREEFLNSCPGSDENQDSIGPIISMFGSARS